MNKIQIEAVIYQYHWRYKELERIHNILFGIGFSQSVGVAQYGVEAVMPKGNTSLKSHAEMNAMDYRERRQYERYLKYKNIVQFVESIEKYVKCDIQLVIYDCMLEGMSYRSIAAHLGMSTGKLHETKESMLNDLASKSQNEQNEHNVRHYANEKNAG